MSFLLISSAFKDDGYMPPWYGRSGSDCSPPIGWTAPPEGTCSLALTVTVSKDGSCLWVVYNIPPLERTFWGRQPRDEVLFDGALQGRNSMGDLGWTGPGDEGSEKVLHFDMSALDVMLDLGPGATADELHAAMEGHVLTTSRLVGRYKPH